MIKTTDARLLRELTQNIGMFLNEQEFCQIREVFSSAIERLLRESESEETE